MISSKTRTFLNKIVPITFIYSRIYINSTMNLENRVSRYALIVPALFSSINPGDEVKKLDITALNNRRLKTEVNILRAQVDELEKGYKGVLEGKKEDDKSDIFDYTKNLSANLTSALRLSSNAFETLATLSVDPQFNARAAVIQDIRQVLPIYEGALRLYEAHSKGEVKLEDPQLSELERRLQVTGSILDAANSYLVSLERPPQEYNVKPEDVKDAKRAFFTGSRKDVDDIAQRILLRVKASDTHEKYLSDYGDQNRSALADFLDRRKRAIRLNEEGNAILEKWDLKNSRHPTLHLALEKYLEASRVDPTHKDSYYNVGSIYAAQRNIPMAATNFSIFLSMPRDADDKEYIIQEARAYVEKGTKVVGQKLFK